VRQHPPVITSAEKMSHPSAAAPVNDEGPKPNERPCRPGRISGGMCRRGSSFGLCLGKLKALRGQAVLVLALAAVQLRLCPGVAHALGATVYEFTSTAVPESPEWKEQQQHSSPNSPRMQQAMTHAPSSAGVYVRVNP
jgi:hypothetical protein